MARTAASRTRRWRWTAAREIAAITSVEISGKAISDTNMTLTPDKTAAEIKIPFLDLISGTTKLPDELYAVVQTN